jgi:tetratricopeptide (TPR) repeat protein
MALRKVGEALKELKLAENLAPGETKIHDLYAQALQMSGDLDAAISEFKEALALDGKQTDVQLELAAALERKGDWVASLQQYRLAALADGGGGRTPLPPGLGRPQYGASRAFTDAQERFHVYLDSLNKAGKPAEASRLEDAVRTSLTPNNASDKLDALMQAGSQAFDERRFDDSERSYKEALLIAEKLPQPEVRVATALGHLGQLTLYKKDFTGAQAAFERQLQVTDQVYGPQTIAGTEPLKWLAYTATAQGDFATAQKFFDRALELNRKAYGEDSTGYSEVLRAVAAVYIYQKAYDKAEVSLLKASDIEAKLYAGREGNFGPMAYTSVNMLCNLYERWGQNEKMESCDRRQIAVIEKLTGPDPTSYIATLLTRDAKALRALGRTEEAAKIEERLKSLQPSAAINPN